MKKIIVLIVVIAGGLLSTLSRAEGPVAEPGPEQALSSDATDIANALINFKVQGCLSQFQDVNLLTSITRTHLDRWTTRYRIVGNVVDMGTSRGSKVMIIDNTPMEIPGGGWTNIYTCEVKK